MSISLVQDWGGKQVQGKILAVDDESDILKIVAFRLSTEGHQVVTALDGEDALRKFQSEIPDLVILDLMLPKVDGFEVCRIIREQSDVPIIILSAKGDELDRLMGFRMGSDDYITKPFSPSELAMRVQAILRRSGQKQAGKAEVRTRIIGELSIDYDRHEVRRSGEFIPLTPKEFELLWVLASNCGYVFSREQLLQKIWDSSYDSDKDNVTVMISRIREKLEKDPSNPKYIKTVWGKGYKLSWEKD